MHNGILSICHMFHIFQIEMFILICMLKVLSSSIIEYRSRSAEHFIKTGEMHPSSLNIYQGISA